MTHSTPKVYHAEPKISLEFEGVKDIPIDKIHLGSTEWAEPKQSKIENLIEYYKLNGKLDKPIIVYVKNDKYYLSDRYLRYYVAKQLGLKAIPAKTGTLEEIRIEDKLRKGGTRVTSQKHGKGVVIKSDSKFTTIRFNDSEEITYDISSCVKRNTLTIGWK